MRWLAVMTVLLGATLTVPGSTTASAATAPAAFYGRAPSLHAGDQITASINGVTCGTSTVNASLEWSLSIPPNAPCAPSDGAAVTFRVNGTVATVTPTPVWRDGGTPADVANGYTMTVPGGSSTTGTTPSTTTATVLYGSIPAAGGFGIIGASVTATIDQVVAATGCPIASMALYATSNGSFVAYVPGTSIAGVNAGFLALFPGGVIPAGTALMGRCV
jgi:hypothetical protein